MALVELINFITENSLPVRIIGNGQSKDWSNWISIPSENYLDCGNEPIPFREVEAIEVCSVVLIERGRLMQPIKKGYAEELEKLCNLEHLTFEIKDKNDIFRILPNFSKE